MITTFVIEVHADEGCALPWFTGHETRAAFLSMIKGYDEGLAETLHRGIPRQAKAGYRSVMSLKALRFTQGARAIRPNGAWRHVGPRDKVLPIDENILVEPGASGWFSVTVMNDELSREVMLAIASAVRTQITVKGCRLTITGVKINVIDPLKTIAQAPDPGTHIDVYFTSPTYLNPLTGDKTYKLLYPELNALMGSLISTAYWLTNQSLPKPTELAQGTYISGIDIRTPQIKPKEPTPTGFVGWIRLRFPENKENKPNENQKKLIHGLLKLAEITNIGGNRASGYGEITTETKQ